MTVRLFVGNLDPRTTAQQLSRFFSSAGLVVSAEIPVDRETGGSRGFGFVDLETEEQAERALVVFDGRKLGSRELRLERAHPSARKSRPAARSQRDRWRGNGEEDFAADAGFRHRDDDDDDRSTLRARRRHGKHGSDRVRGRGMRRVIE